MQVLDSLIIEGTSKLAILCYAVFSREELDTAFHALRKNNSDARTHKLFDEGWENGILLTEVIMPSDVDFLPIAVDQMARMFRSGPCIATVCMFDGAFGSYEDIFAPELAPQIYAFSFSEHSPSIVADSYILASVEWRSVVGLARQRIK